MFAGELEVEGDLNVTGNISSQTIDSLLQVIADLQSQITSFQIQLESLNSNITSRQYTLTVNPSDIIDLEELTGQLLDWYMIDIVKVTSAGNWNNISLFAIGHASMVARKSSTSGSAYYTYADNHPLITIPLHKELRVENINQSAEISLMITGPFNQQIKE